ncbi:alpha-L-fucosidase [Mucilaginibacter arboris]|uniref:alpha-L-fucosidase n=1 Tax=Mucilaginibacter arboris TaxID=2682090 RepID=A0A7K1ST13_9SPHI|nr:alpha-L-fucosidase [Mucilaginibacter arboris]MVN20456.1 glycoside hydrolase family 29 [Mucilaginibacter arboris]
MKKSFYYTRIFKFIAVWLMLAETSLAQVKEVPKPNNRQLAWQQAEFGVLLSYDLHVFDTTRYIQASNRITPIADYNIFNPKQLDMEQWVRAAKAAGAKFAVFTATHETGFAMFQSDVNPYSLKALKWRDGKADLVREFVNACRKYDIKPGIYLGIRWNSFLGVHDFKVDGAGEMQKQRQKYYNTMVEGMVKEICTKYGQLFEIWFDGGASSPEKGAPDVLPIVKKYQPDCLFYHNDQLAEARWGGSESGTVGYPCWATFPYHFTGSGESAIPGISANGYALLKNGDPEGKYWVPAMADVPLRGYNGRHEWFWEPGDESHIFPLNNLVEMYYKSVGRNATLILGLTPDNRGLLPQADVQRLKEFGTEIKCLFENPIAEKSGSGTLITIKLDKPVDMDQIVIAEDITQGERIRSYEVEANLSGKWQSVCNGQSIGNKRIQTFKTVNTNQIRLRIIKSDARPVVKLFQVFKI